MSIEVFSNNATTTLGSAAAPSDTTMTLAVGTGALFPSPSAGQYFTATLWAAGSTTGVPNEIVHVTAISGDTVTVVRGQEGTTAQSWSVGDTFANYITANFLNNILTAVDLQSQSGNSAVDTGTANAGVITLSPAITSLAQLLYSPIRVYKINSPNTGAYTLNINGQGAKSVTLGGVALAAAQLLGHQVFEVFWDGTNLELLSVPAVIENVGLALMAAGTAKANITGSPATPADVPLAHLFAAFLGGGALTSPGYFTIPMIVGGVGVLGYVQFGPLSVTTSGSAFATGSLSFDTAFPNACFGVLGCCQQNAGGNPAASGGNYTAIFYSETVDGCDFRVDNESGHLESIAVTGLYVAFGY